MLDNQGFEILYNGVPRTFRGKRETAFEAARYAKGKARGEILWKFETARPELSWSC